MEYWEAIEILSMREGFNNEELKKQYKKLISKNHPDRYLSLDNNIIEMQVLITQKINIAYETLSNYLNKYISDEKNTIFEQEPAKIFHRKVEHPDHADQSFRWLWHKIKKVQADGDYSLALELWSMSIIYLLKDFKRYPDIDGIIHNYIRDYSSLLLRLGMYEEAFCMIKTAVVNNVMSYYDFHLPTKLLYNAILKTRFRREAVSSWEKLFMGEVIVKDISVQWAMLYTFYVNKEYLKLFDYVEKGYIIPPSEGNLLSEYIDKEDYVFAINSFKFAENKDCKIFCKLKDKDINKYKYGMINILIESKKKIDIFNFSEVYPVSEKIMKGYSKSILNRKAYAIPEKIPAMKGFCGEDKKFIVNKCVKNEAINIFNQYIITKKLKGF